MVIIVALLSSCVKRKTNTPSTKTLTRSSANVKPPSHKATAGRKTRQRGCCGRPCDLEMDVQRAGRRGGSRVFHKGYNEPVTRRRSTKGRTGLSYTIDVFDLAGSGRLATGARHKVWRNELRRAGRISRNGKE